MKHIYDGEKLRFREGGKMSKGKQNYRYSTLENLRYVYAGAAKWQPLVLLCTFVLAVTEGLKYFVWIYGGKKIIEVLEKSGGGIENFQKILWIVLIGALTEGLLLLGMNISQTTASSRITDIRCKFVLMTNRKIMKMPYVMFDNQKVGDTKRKCDRSTADMNNGFEGMLRESSHFLSQFVTMLTAAGILFFLNPFLVFIMCVLAAGRGWINNRMSRYEKEKFHDKMVPTWRHEYYYYRTTSDFQYAKDIRIFNMQDAIGQKQQGLWDIIHKNTRKLQNRWIGTHLGEGVIELLQEGVMYAWLIYAVLKQGMSVADFTLYVGSIRNFNTAMGQLLQRWTHMVQDSRLICDYRNFLEYPEKGDEITGKSTFRKDYESYLGKNKRKYPPIPAPKDGQYEFRFENVSFSYPGSRQYALKDLNITLKAGKRLAVVGLNGAGKTTFINLLCRLYEPTEGTIYMNGQDIAQYDIEEYFALIAPVFQNVQCFALPLAENVSMTLPEETDKERASLCMENAGLGEKLKTLQHGADTELLKFLREDGIELSGGEKQKMALARALYKDAPVVVLDEPTAALDALAEYKTYMDFDKLIGGKTAVYISHRLSSTRFCHNVAMFESGRMVEYGTHEELLKAGGAYAKMFEVQAQYYKEGEVAANA